MDGTTTWQVLYDQYPSQGTNTFIGDYGNYDVVPAVPHPKYSPTRFYQILDDATNTAPSPSVTILSQTNGQLLSGQVTVLVTASSTLPVLSTTLYVDGQEMDQSDDGSNYVLNTCEWPNGAHTLLAVATARSAMCGPSGVYPIYTGYGVSPYLSVTFSNLITSIAFSQPFFQPSLGQTQQVSALFGANCNWTLQIQDENSNTVCNASGSGMAMAYEWDGTGDGETNIADGVYTYLVTAQTNGQTQIVGGGGSPPSGGPPPVPAMESQTSQLWAISSDSDVPVPLLIYPPGFDTNGFVILAAFESDIYPQALPPSLVLQQA